MKVLTIDINVIIIMTARVKIGKNVDIHAKVRVIPLGWGSICDGVNCYIRKCTIYYP